jgi:hypothetical protein
MALAGEGAGRNELAHLRCATTHARNAREVERKLSNLMAHLAPSGSSLDQKSTFWGIPQACPLSGVADNICHSQIVRF